MTGLLHAGCQGCAVRSIANGPQFHQAQRIGRLTAEYKRLLTLGIGGDVQEAHAKVKSFHEKVKT